MRASADKQPAVRELCERCSAASDRQVEQMRPREIREGVALIAKVDALRPFSVMPFPDVRLGDVVRVQLLSASVEDMPWCEEPDCANNMHLREVESWAGRSDEVASTASEDGV